MQLFSPTLFYPVHFDRSGLGLALVSIGGLLAPADMSPRSATGSAFDADKSPRSNKISRYTFIILAYLYEFIYNLHFPSV